MARYVGARGRPSPRRDDQQRGRRQPPGRPASRPPRRWRPGLAGSRAADGDPLRRGRPARRRSCAASTIARARPRRPRRRGRDHDPHDSRSNPRRPARMRRKEPSVPVDALRPAVHALMDRAKADLAELVAFRSVADPSSTRPRSARRRRSGSSTRSPRSACRTSRCRRRPTAATASTATRPGPEGVADRAAVLPLRRAAAARRGRVDGAGVRSSPSATGAGTAAASADCKGNIVMHLTALRALREANGGFPCGDQADLRGLRGAGHRRAGGVRAPTTPTCCARTRSSSVDTGNFAVGVPTLTTTLRGMTSVDVTLDGARQRDALRHVRRPGARRAGRA